TQSTHSAPRSAKDMRPSCSTGTFLRCDGRPHIPCLAQVGSAAARPDDWLPCRLSFAKDGPARSRSLAADPVAGRVAGAFRRCWLQAAAGAPTCGATTEGDVRRHPPSRRRCEAPPAKPNEREAPPAKPNEREAPPAKPNEM